MRWIAPLTTEPDATVSATANGYLVISGDDTTAVDRDGVATAAAIGGPHPGTRVPQSLRACDLHVCVADDGTACGIDGSGRVRWRFRAGRRVDVAPALCGDVIVFATIHRSVVGVDAGSGRLRWTTNLEARARACPCVVR